MSGDGVDALLAFASGSQPVDELLLAFAFGVLVGIATVLALLDAATRR